MRAKRWGDSSGQAPPRPTPTQRFWGKVDQNGPDWELGRCWEWIGAHSTAGYGQINVGGRSGKVIYTHRFAYELLVGPIPDGYDLDHLCRNRGCCNPTHLEPVTHRENALRGTSPNAMNAAKTHCHAGHPFDESNTSYRQNGHRGCLACRRERRYWLRNNGYESYRAEDIFDRDGWTCHLCGKSIDPSVPRTEPFGATIDHLIPTSQGGYDNPTNVAAAHRQCNVRRQDQPLIAQEDPTLLRLAADYLDRHAKEV